MMASYQLGTRRGRSDAQVVAGAGYDQSPEIEAESEAAPAARDDVIKPDDTLLGAPEQGV